MICKLKSFINNKSGKYSGGLYIWAIIIIYITIIISILFGKMYTIFLQGEKVKETMKEACIYVMTSNWDELYSSIREGYAGAYNFSGEELLDADRVYDIMATELETTKNGGEYIKYLNGTSGEYVFKYYDIEMDMNNTGFRNVNDSYNIDLKITFEAPFNLLFIHYPMIVELKHKARWRAKY